MTIKQRLTLAYRMELTALVLLFFATGAQLFTQDLSSLVQRGSVYELSHKLDVLWQLESKQAGGTLRRNGDALGDVQDLAKRYGELTGNLRQAKAQGSAGLKVYLALFVLGSATFIGGRYIERSAQLAKEKDEPNKAPEPTSTSVTSPADAGAAPAAAVAHL